MRLFVGIPVPAAPAFTNVAAELAALPGARTVPGGSWHITLRFLGEVDEADEVADAVDAAVRGRHKLQAVVEGLGTFSSGFPPDSKARVAWAGVRAHGLESLAKAVQDATADFGEPADRAAFVGHVTLARFAKPADLRVLVARHKGTLFAQGTLDRVVVYRSDLGPGGARHVPLHTAVLGEA